MDIDIDNLKIDEEDNENANLYINDLKGRFLYLHVIQIFQSKFPEKKFNYKEISSFIRYDKSLRNILYRYFAFLEEKYRTLVLNEIDIEEIRKIKVEGQENKFKSHVIYTKKLIKTNQNYIFIWLKIK